MAIEHECKLGRLPNLPDQTSLDSPIWHTSPLGLAFFTLSDKFHLVLFISHNLRRFWIFNMSFFVHLHFYVFPERICIAVLVSVQRYFRDCTEMQGQASCFMQKSPHLMLRVVFFLKTLHILIPTFVWHLKRKRPMRQEDAFKKMSDRRGAYKMSETQTPSALGSTLIINQNKRI